MQLTSVFPALIARVIGVCFVAAAISAAGAAEAERTPVAGFDIHDMKLLNRITWGINLSAVRAMNRVGAEAYLEQQLRPSSESGLPAQAQAEIDVLAISQRRLEDLVTEIDLQGKSANAIADAEQKQAAQKEYQETLNRLGREAATRSLLRDLYSPHQLQEQLTWFWLNHFNVHLYKSNIRLLIGDYEDSAIRRNALGRFRDLLGATLHHPAMLRYLDNDQNAAGHLNENYAREIMELHTMGVGSGYSQKDVEELARILTGVGVNQTASAPKLKPELEKQYVHKGLFEFNPNRHDDGDKVFLGRSIKGRGLAEVDEALDMLSQSPATSRFISRKLALYFVSDYPPASLVEKMAAAFRQTDGDIAAVLRTMFHAPEYDVALGRRFKDPMHYAISAVRFAYDDKVALNMSPLQGWLGRLGQPLYGHETPDGYPLSVAAWSGPGQMAARFEIARAIGGGPAGLFKPDSPQSAERPAFPLIANALYFAGLKGMLNAATTDALDQAISPQDWNTLVLASPDFMYR